VERRFEGVVATCRSAIEEIEDVFGFAEAKKQAVTASRKGDWREMPKRE